MPEKFHITQCAIEFRVKRPEFEAAVKYYEDLFDAKEKARYPDLVLLELDKHPGKWFFVGVRAVADNNSIAGPVVYWFTDASVLAAYQSLLDGRPPGATDEPPAGNSAMAGGRSSIMDIYGNRFGISNPDYPP